MPHDSHAQIRAGLCAAALAIVTGPLHAASAQWVPSAQVAAPAPQIGASFGAAVALAGDVLVVGEPNAFPTGQAHVFQRSGTQWAFKQTLGIVQPRNGAHFGAHVAIKGNNIVVGAPDDDTGGHGAGAFHLYRYDPSADYWQPLGKSFDTLANAHLGSAVAITNTLVVIGEPGFINGRALVYQYSTAGGSWSGFGTVDADIGATAFGSSVALFESSSPLVAPILAVGAPSFSQTGAVGCGAVHVYHPNNGNWELYTTIVEVSPHDNDGFGSSVAVSLDRVMGGSPWRDDPQGAAQAGSVSIFRPLASPFPSLLDDEVFPSNGSSGSEFGAHVAFNFDGVTDRLLTGARLGNQPGAADAGSAFVSGSTAHVSIVWYTVYEKKSKNKVFVEVEVEGLSHRRSLKVLKMWMDRLKDMYGLTDKQVSDESLYELYTGKRYHKVTKGTKRGK